MATSPDEVRTGLTIVTAAAAAEVVAAAEPAETADDLRTVLFLAAPIIIGDYSDGAAALALDWYEELREEAAPRKAFAPEPFRAVTDDYMRSVIAETTSKLIGLDGRDFDEAKRPTLELVRDSIPEMVADGFRETVTRNSINDPATAGWRRFARPGACKFCKMLADKGAVFSATTARFAAHGAVMRGNRKGGDCKCVAAPVFRNGDVGPEASAIQYVASRRKRTPKQRTELRDYLNENFPDARG